MIKAVSQRRKSEDAAVKYKHCWEELRQEQGALEREKKTLQRKLGKALSSAEAEAATGAEKATKAEQQGYHRGYEVSIGFIRKVLLTLSPAFYEEGYFNAYLQQVE